MRHYWRPVILRIGFVLAGLPVTFLLLVSRVRRLETSVIGWTMNAMGAHGVRPVPPAYVLLVPHGRGGFLAELSPSCSSLAPVLALFFLIMSLPVATVRRRLLAVSAAAALVVVGNILRIDACLGVGMLMGRSSLVLFHDWLASAFGFAYAMAGFIVAVAILLPSRRERERMGAGLLPRTRPAPAAVATP